MLENKPIYPPKMKHNKPAFSAAKYLRVQLKVHWLNIFKNKFPQVNETESLPHTHTQLKNYEPDSECENKKDKPLLMIVFDIIIFFFKEWNFKKVRIYKYT